MRVPPIRKACVERREHCAPVLVGSVVGRKVRVGQRGRVADGGELRGLAVSVPDATTDPMTVLEVFDPTGASLELVLRNFEGLGDIPGSTADQRIGKIGLLTRSQPINELALDLWELGRSELGGDQC